jgi:hypothetical protein
MKRILLFFGVCLLMAAPNFTPRIFAQTALEIEGLLASDALNYEQAASFVLKAADITASGSAFNYAYEQKWLPANAAPGGLAKLEGVSLLIMGAFGINGGIMFSAVKNPHYAYRELVYKGIIQGRADPGLAVPGALLFFIVGRVLDLTEGDNL